MELEHHGNPDTILSSLDEKLACLKSFAEEVTSANKMVLNDVASKVDPWIQGFQVPLDEAKDFLEAAQYLSQEASSVKTKLTMTRRYYRTKMQERLMHGGNDQEVDEVGFREGPGYFNGAAAECQPRENRLRGPDAFRGGWR